mmetsp:Transcript_77950/g.156026  ORF Transcript_77950/g.156026 Transcript_77950/m.156026 type:complete len:208 (-) Transcript_77950:581-1204(-)
MMESMGLVTVQWLEKGPKRSCSKSFSVKFEKNSCGRKLAAGLCVECKEEANAEEANAGEEVKCILSLAMVSPHSIFDPGYTTPACPPEFGWWGPALIALLPINPSLVPPQPPAVLAPTPPPPTPAPAANAAAVSASSPLSRWVKRYVARKSTELEQCADMGGSKEQRPLYTSSMTFMKEGVSCAARKGKWWWKISSRSANKWRLSFG